MSGCRRGAVCSAAQAGPAGALPDFTARYAGIGQRAVRRVPQLPQRLAIGKPPDNAVSKLPATWSSSFCGQSSAIGANRAG